MKHALYTPYVFLCPRKSYGFRDAVLNRSGVRAVNSGKWKTFLQRVQTVCGAHASSCVVVTEGPPQL
jgi:hypothetical protein